MTDAGKTALLWAIGEQFASFSEGDLTFGALSDSFKAHHSRLDRRRREDWRKTYNAFAEGTDDFEGGDLELFRPRSSRFRPNELRVFSVDVPGEAILDAINHRGVERANADFEERAKLLLEQADATLLVVRADVLENPVAHSADRVYLHTFIRDSLAHLGDEGRPVAVVLTAVDALADDKLRAALEDEALPRDERSRLVREFLEREIHSFDAAASHCACIDYFGVSAFGCAPSEQQAQVDGRIVPRLVIQDPRPKFVREPLLWALRRIWRDRDRTVRQRRRSRLARAFLFVSVLLAALPLMLGRVTSFELRTDAISLGSPIYKAVAGAADVVRGSLPPTMMLRRAAVHALHRQVLLSELEGRVADTNLLIDRLSALDDDGYVTARAARAVLQQRFERTRETEGAEMAARRLDSEQVLLGLLDRYTRVQLGCMILASRLAASSGRHAVQMVIDGLKSDPLLAIEHGLALSSEAVDRLLAGILDADPEVARDYDRDFTEQAIVQLAAVLPSHLRRSLAQKVADRARSALLSAIDQGAPETAIQVVALASSLSSEPGDQVADPLVAIGRGLADAIPTLTARKWLPEHVQAVLLSYPTLARTSPEAYVLLYEHWCRGGQMGHGLALLECLRVADVEVASLPQSEDGLLLAADLALLDELDYPQGRAGAALARQVWKTYSEALVARDLSDWLAGQERFVRLGAARGAEDPSLVVGHEDFAAAVAREILARIDSAGEDAARLEPSLVVEALRIARIGAGRFDLEIMTGLRPLFRRAEQTWPVVSLVALFGVLGRDALEENRSLARRIAADVVTGSAALGNLEGIGVLAVLGQFDLGDPELQRGVELKALELLRAVVELALDESDVAVFAASLVEIATNWGDGQERLVKSLTSAQRARAADNLLRATAKGMQEGRSLTTASTLSLACKLSPERVTQTLGSTLAESAEGANGVIKVVEAAQLLVASKALDDLVLQVVTAAGAMEFDRRAASADRHPLTRREEESLHALASLLGLNSDTKRAWLARDTRRVFADRAIQAYWEELGVERVEQALEALGRAGSLLGSAMTPTYTLRRFERELAVGNLCASKNVAAGSLEAQLCEAWAEESATYLLDAWSGLEDPLEDVEALRSAGADALGGDGWSFSQSQRNRLLELLQLDARRLGAAKAVDRVAELYRLVEALWPADVDVGSLLPARLVRQAADTGFRIACETLPLEERIVAAESWPGGLWLRDHWVRELGATHLAAGHLEGALNAVARLGDSVERNRLQAFLDDCRGLVLLLPDDANAFLIMPDEVTVGQYRSFVDAMRSTQEFARVSAALEPRHPGAAALLSHELLARPLDIGASELGGARSDLPIHRVPLIAARAYAAHRGMQIPTEEDLLRVWGQRHFPWGEAWSDEAANLRSQGAIGLRAVVGSRASLKGDFQVPVQHSRGPVWVYNLIGNVSELVEPESGGSTAYACGGSAVDQVTPEEVAKWPKRGALRRTPPLEIDRGYAFVGFRCVLPIPPALQPSAYESLRVSAESLTPLASSEPKSEALAPVSASDRGMDVVAPALSFPEPWLDGERYRSTPSGRSLRIPASDEHGAVWGIEVAARDQPLVRARVIIDIEHASPHSLVAVLTLPGGRRVDLPSPPASETERALAIYVVDSDSALGELSGLEVAGNWRLTISDRTGQPGYLHGWVLDLWSQPVVEPGTERLVLPAGSIAATAARFAHHFRAKHGSLDIPDGVSGCVSHIDVPDGVGPVTDLAVELDIQHTYTGDLVVSLVHPDGTNVKLFERARGDADNIRTLFGATALEQNVLRGLVGKPGSGRWRLQIADRASYDRGTLVSWALHLNQ